MHIIEVLTMIITTASINIGLISWLRSDMKSFEVRMESWMSEFKRDISNEMRDFHGRLCSLEARYFDDRMKKKDK